MVHLIHGIQLRDRVTNLRAEIGKSSRDDSEAGNRSADGVSFLQWLKMLGTILSNIVKQCFECIKRINL